jgi:hypothetical protein
MKRSALAAAIGGALAAPVVFLKGEHAILMTTAKS